MKLFKSKDEVPDFNPQFPVNGHEMDNGITKVKKIKGNWNWSEQAFFYLFIAFAFSWVILMFNVEMFSRVHAQTVPVSIETVEMVDNTIEEVKEPQEAINGSYSMVFDDFAATLTETEYKIMMCESSGNPLAKNPNSSASGLFQFIDGTWNGYCTGDVFNPEDNLRCFRELYPKHKSWWECDKLI